MAHSQNPNISIKSKLGYLAIMYLDALTIITVITLQIEAIVKSVVKIISFLSGTKSSRLHFRFSDLVPPKAMAA